MSTPQLKKANVDVEVWIKSIGEDPLQYGVCTVGLWAGGDVLSIDEDKQTTNYGQLNVWTASTDPNIQGVAATGTRDKRIRDPVALYGGHVLTGEKVGVYKYGKIRIRVADDLTAMNIGDIAFVAEDSQTIEEQASQTVAVADNAAWEVLTAAGVTATDIINLHTDLSQVLGSAAEYLAAADGGDEDDRRGKFIMNLQPYRLLTAA